MSQPLPLSPQIPAFDGRMPASRERPVEDGERGTQRHAFGRLLDRFTRPDRDPEDAPADTLAGAQERRPRERRGDLDDTQPAPHDPLKTDDDHLEPLVVEAGAPPPPARPIEPATSTINVKPAPGDSTVITMAVQVQAAATAGVAGPAHEAANPVGAIPSRQAAAAATVAPITDMVGTVASPNMQPTTKPTEAIADATAATDAPALNLAALSAAPARRTIAAGDTGERSTKNTKAATTPEKLPAEPIAPQAVPLPKPQVDGEAVPPTDSTQALRQVRAAAAGVAAAATEPAARLAGRDERQGAPRSADQPVIALQGMDSPRSAAAVYHKVADAVRPGADTPSAADQVSIRLIHAVAEGKRAIQMHLHPAELGSIDVKMQWQGDRLTAQFLVDRPETLQLLQREVPALERSLGQAGIDLGSNGLSFSLRQQQGNGQGGGQPFNPGGADPAFADGAELPAGDEPLGQVIRDGILSIRV